MKQLMVISHDTYANGLTVATSDIDDLSSLSTGAVVFIDKDPESAAYNKACDLAAASETQTPTKFQVVTMTANGLKFSPIIKKADCTVKYKAYTAPVAKVMAIGNHTSYGSTTDELHLPSLEVGQEAGFIITDLTKDAHVLSRNRRYVYTVGSGDTTVTIIAALKALVNADASRVVTAADGYVTSFDGTGIKFTARTAGNNFQISLIGILRSADISTVTANVLGHGTATQIAAYEDLCEIEQGNGNYPQYRGTVFTKASEVNTSTPGTYDTYMFRFNTPTERPILQSINPSQELLIAVLSTLTGHTTDNTNEAFFNLEADFNV